MERCRTRPRRRTRRICKRDTSEDERFTLSPTGWCTATSICLPDSWSNPGIGEPIEAPSQPPYPIIPAHELYGTMLLELKRPAEAAKHFAEALKRTPGRPMAVYGIARAAEALGDKSTAVARYTQFLELWKD